MTADVLLFTALALVGFACSAVFSGLETGIYTLNPVRLVVQATAGRPAARRLRHEIRHPARTLVVLLLGNNAANFLGSYAIAELLHHMGRSDGEIIVLELLFFTPLLFVFAETLPKDLFRTHTDRWTYWLSPVLLATRWAVTLTGLLPVVLLFSKVVRRIAGGESADAASARQRVSRFIKEGVGSGVLTESQTTMADRVLAMREHTVQGVMIAWRYVATVPIDADRALREARFREHGHSRLPVVGAGDGTVRGMLDWSDVILGPQKATAELLQEAVLLEPGLSVRDALAVMRGARTSIAVVQQRGARRPLGIVTIKDLVEPLTGKLAAW